jgi:hypothetical protein
METVIIGQGYNIKENTSVGKELVEQFNTKRYKSFIQVSQVPNLPVLIDRFQRND